MKVVVVGNETLAERMPTIRVALLGVPVHEDVELIPSIIALGKPYKDFMLDLITLVHSDPKIVMVYVLLDGGIVSEWFDDMTTADWREIRAAVKTSDGFAMYWTPDELFHATGS